MNFIPDTILVFSEIILGRLREEFYDFLHLLYAYSVYQFSVQLRLFILYVLY